MTTTQAALELDVSSEFIRGEIRAGRLDARVLERPGKRVVYRITADQFEEYVARLWPNHVRRVQVVGVELAAVYFVQCGEFVKIGLSGSVAQRLAGLRHGNPTPMRLLGVVRPTAGQSLRSVECAFHQRFAASRHHGEWFRFEGLLEAFCERLSVGDDQPRGL